MEDDNTGVLKGAIRVDQEQLSRPIVGVVLYAVAASLAWFVHPLLGILIFVAMIGYRAWTSQGVKKGHGEE